MTSIPSSTRNKLQKYAHALVELLANELIYTKSLKDETASEISRSFLETTLEELIRHNTYGELAPQSIKDIIDDLSELQIHSLVWSSDLKAINMGRIIKEELFRSQKYRTMVVAAYLDTKNSTIFKRVLEYRTELLDLVNATHGLNLPMHICTDLSTSLSMVNRLLDLCTDSKGKEGMSKEKEGMSKEKEGMCSKLSENKTFISPRWDAVADQKVIASNHSARQFLKRFRKAILIYLDKTDYFMNKQLDYSRAWSALMDWDTAANSPYILSMYASYEYKVRSQQSIQKNMVADIKDKVISSIEKALKVFPKATDAHCLVLELIALLMCALTKITCNWFEEMIGESALREYEMNEEGRRSDITTQYYESLVFTNEIIRSME